MTEFAMHDAAEKNDLERVRQLIEAGVPVDSRDEEGRTPLHWAASEEVAELLINSKCDIDIKDRYGDTPVMVAARSWWRHENVVDLLLHRGARVTCINEDGGTLLHCVASDRVNPDTLRLILDKGEADLNPVNQDGETPLIVAARDGHEEILSLLIRAGADINRSDDMDCTALHKAVYECQTRMVQILLEEEGLDLNLQDENGNTPLHVACTGSRQEAIKPLLDAGANIDVKNEQGRTALSEGLWRYKLNHEQIRLFVQKGAFLENCDYEEISMNDDVLKDVELCTLSVMNKFNRQSLPALNSFPYFARRLPDVDNFKLGARDEDEVRNLVKCEIERNTFCNVVKVRPISLSALCVLSLIEWKKSVVDLLLHRGAQVSCINEDRGTLLHCVASDNHWPYTLCLNLDKGEADLNPVNYFGETPLIVAARHGHKEILSLLILAGADVNRSDCFSSTALHKAVYECQTRVVQILLEEEGLDLNLQDETGDTPLHVACTGSRQEAIKPLLDAGANIDVKNEQGRTALSEGLRRYNLNHEQIRLFVQKGAFLENCDYKEIYRGSEGDVLKDVELCTQSVVNKFNRQSLPALNSIPYFSRRLPDVDNFKLGARDVDEVRNLVKCEIERNTFCNVVKVHPISLSALCVLSLITCQPGKKRAASTGFGHSPIKKSRN